MWKAGTPQSDDTAKDRPAEPAVHGILERSENDMKQMAAGSEWICSVLNDMAEDELKHITKEVHDIKPRLPVPDWQDEPVDITTALRWDCKFKDPQLELQYSAEWWLQTRQMLLHARILAIIQAFFLLFYAFVLQGSEYLVAQLMQLTQLCCAWALAYFHVGAAQKHWGQHLTLFSLFFPLYIVWTLSAIFEQQLKGTDGWCHLDWYNLEEDTENVHDIMCEAIRLGKLPHEVYASFLTCAAVLIVYIKISWVWLGAHLAVFVIITLVTLGWMPGTGCTLLGACSLVYIFIAQTQELAHRQAFLAKHQIINQASAIAKYSEALTRQGNDYAAWNAPGAGYGCGGGAAVADPGPGVGMGSIMGSDDLPPELLSDVISDELLDTLAHQNQAVLANTSQQMMFYNSQREQLSADDANDVPSAKRPRMAMAGAANDSHGTDIWRAVGPALMEASHDAMMVINRDTLEFVAVNSNCSAVLLSLSPDVTQGAALLKHHLRAVLFAKNPPGNFKDSYTTSLLSTAGEQAYNIIGVSGNDSKHVVVTMQNMSEHIRQQTTLQVMTDQMVYLATLVANNGKPGQPYPKQPSNSNSRSDSPTDRSDSDTGGRSPDAITTVAPPMRITPVPPRGVVMPAKIEAPAEEPLQFRQRPLAPARKPYRFCVPCWIMTKKWVVKAVTAPNGQNMQMGGHTQLSCPNWPDNTEPTPEQHRAYGAAFKRAARQSIHNDIAFEVFKHTFPDMSDTQIRAHLAGYQV